MLTRVQSAAGIYECAFLDALIPGGVACERAEGGSNVCLVERRAMMRVSQAQTRCSAWHQI